MLESYGNTGNTHNELNPEDYNSFANMYYKAHGKEPTIKKYNKYMRKLHRYADNDGWAEKHPNKVTKFEQQYIHPLKGGAGGILKPASYEDFKEMYSQIYGQNPTQKQYHKYMEVHQRYTNPEWVAQHPERAKQIRRFRDMYVDIDVADDGVRGAAEYGPEYEAGPKYDNGLIDFIDECSKFIGKLSLFDKYIVWRYTIGSASVNYRLIFDQISPNTPRWVYLFFKYFKNTVKAMEGRGVEPDDLPGFFKNYIGLFNSPYSYTKLPDGDKIRVNTIVLVLYTNRLKTILKNGPVVREPFRVYKISSYYPALPDVNNFRATMVEQKPFNSVTVTDKFNFEPFASKEKDNYIFDIDIPAGTRGILYVPTDLHAYNFEHEIIIPPGVNFFVTNFSTQQVNYIDPAQIKLKVIQNPTDTKEPASNQYIMGNVYSLNEYAPCIGQCDIQTKYMTVFSAIYKP